MNYQQLGQSMLRISEIGFGCMSLGDSQTANEYLLHKALETGINFFDTADLYQKGFNEESIGKALRGRRDKVVLASKVGNQWRADGSGWDWNPRKEYILAAVEKSLQRLQTDHIDLYQLHGGTINDPIDETIEAFELLQQQGKIRYCGISSIRPNVIREYVRRSHIVSVMMQYSLLDRRPAETCLDLLRENNIGVLARGSVAGGLLVNKPGKDYLGYTTAQVQAVAGAVAAVSGTRRNAAQTAIRWVLQHPAITSAIVGIRTEEQLNEAVDAVKTPLLTEAETNTLQGAVAANVYAEHR
jgi:aryl-alcohol dehydrogenase-like predicted oxidoreductase